MYVLSDLDGETTYKLLDNRFHTKLVGISP